MASFTCPTTLFEIVACAYGCAQRRARGRRHPGIWMLLILVSWTGIAAALEADDPSGFPQSTAPSADFGADYISERHPEQLWRLGERTRDQAS
jgi:hypothetical protein